MNRCERHQYLYLLYALLNQVSWKIGLMELNIAITIGLILVKKFSNIFDTAKSFD